MTLVIASHVVLFLAMLITLIFILRIRCFSYDYSHINTNNVTLVLIVYMMSYIIRAIYLGCTELIIEAELKHDFTSVAIIMFIAHFTD